MSEIETDNPTAKFEFDFDDETVVLMSNVFIVINEWESEDCGDTTLQEIVGGRWFSSEDEAWSHLSDIADEYDMELPPEATAFDVPDEHAIRNQSYYIQELTKGND